LAPVAVRATLAYTVAQSSDRIELNRIENGLWPKVLFVLPVYELVGLPDAESSGNFFLCQISESAGGPAPAP